MREVGKRVRKKDAMALVTGQPVYTDDLAPKECLIVKVLRSPHANAIVEEVNKTVALKFRVLKLFIHGRMSRKNVLRRRGRRIRSGVRMIGSFWISMYVLSEIRLQSWLVRTRHA